MTNVHLIENHDEALKIWRKQGIKNFDLVHIDAHMDFGFHLARSIKEIINEAKSLKNLKKDLEASLAYLHYEQDFTRQTNIGNYIYPATKEGIVRNFYWIIPGQEKEFRQSLKSIKKLFRNLLKCDPHQLRCTPDAICYRPQAGIISTKLLGRNFTVCTLEKMPLLRQKVILDIDTDFLIIDSLLNANNTTNIGKRKPWILPQGLVEILKRKIKQPQIITIAYSVNGGYTPIRYRHLADEIAYYFAPNLFKWQFENSFRAAGYFDNFNSTQKKLYYQKAVKLNSAYRAADNNYGPLYLRAGKFNLARKEFLKVLSADPKNPACLLGLGNIFLQKRRFREAKKHYVSAINLARNSELFTKVKNQSLFGLAKAEFSLKNFKKAKKLLIGYKVTEPFQPYTYYLLGCIFEKEKKFLRAVIFYKDAIRLGFNGIGPIERLLKISCQLKEKGAIIKYVRARYIEFKNSLFQTKRLRLKDIRVNENLRKTEEKMLSFEKQLVHLESLNYPKKEA